MKLQSDKTAIFLTGGGGFVGKNIINNLSQTYNFIAPKRQDLELRDFIAVDNYFTSLGNIDCIIHGANVGGMRNSTINEADCLHENVVAFRNLYQQYCHNSQINKFIQLGSGAEYGKPLYKSNISEVDIGNYLPHDAYGLSKLLCGKVIDSESNKQSLNLRIFGIFGPHEDYRVRFISNAIIRSLFDLPIVVNQNAEFDYLYVRDFVKILEYFIKYPTKYRSYNVVSGKVYTLIELAKIVKDLTHNRHEIIIKNALVNQSYTACNQRLMEFLPSDFMFTDITIAINELIYWYQSNIETIEYDKK